MKMNPHPVAEIFPAMSPADYLELKNDIKERGLLNPIITYENKILDGRHRYNVCLEIGMQPKFTNFTNTTISALDYVVSQNLRRRHLTLGQKAAIAVRYKEEISKQLVQNKKHNQLTPKDQLTGKKERSNSIAGRMFGISSDAVDRAHCLKRKDPSLFKAVADGNIRLRTAHSKIMSKKQPEKPFINPVDETVHAMGKLGFFWVSCYDPNDGSFKSFFFKDPAFKSGQVWTSCKSFMELKDAVRATASDAKSADAKLLLTGRV